MLTSHGRGFPIPHRALLQAAMCTGSGRGLDMARSNPGAGERKDSRMSKYVKREARLRRHRRVRAKVCGSASVPRMSVCRTDKHIYVQFINDDDGRTLAAVSTLDRAFRDGDHKPDLQGASVLGTLAAERALAADIRRVVFDRGGSKYHGRIKAVADAARAAGLQF